MRRIVRAVLVAVFSGLAIALIVSGCIDDDPAGMMIGVAAIVCAILSSLPAGDDGEEERKSGEDVNHG